MEFIEKTLENIFNAKEGEYLYFCKVEPRKMGKSNAQTVPAMQSRYIGYRSIDEIVKYLDDPKYKLLKVTDDDL